MERWDDPELLKNYLEAKRAPGIYIIGSPNNNGAAPSPSNEDNPYLLSNWPDNFKPEYVGISESLRPGVRGRLSCHARMKGNKHLANLIEQGVDLYFIAIYGNVLISMHEPLFIALKAEGQFEGNIRLEYKRNQKKRHDKIHELMTGKKLSYNVLWDFDGDGM